MANLNLTQVEFDEIFRISSVFFELLNTNRALWNKFKDRFAHIKEEFDDVGKLSDWVLNGTDIGINTDENRRLYVDSNEAAGTVTVDVFKDAAKANKVATGAAAAGSTVTLAESNNSGITGTVKTDAGSVTDTDIVLRVIQDAELRVDRTFPIEEVDGGRAKTRLLNLIDTSLRSQSGSLFTAVLTFFQNEITGASRYYASRLDAPQSEVGTIHNYEYDTTTPGGGAVSIERERGIIGVLIDAMRDNTIAQTILSQTVTLGSFDADPDNIGVVQIQSSGTRNNALPASVHFELESEEVGQETYKVTARLDQRLSTGDRFIEAVNRIRINQPWIDGRIGLSLTLERGPVVETGDTGAILANYTSISGETAANTDDGTIYFRVLRQASAPIWKISIFNDAGRTNEIGFTTTDGIVGVVNLSISGNGLSVTFDFDKAAANTALPAATNFQDSQIDLKVGKLEDFYDMRIENDRSSNFARDFGYYFQVELPSSGTPTIDDGMATPADLVFMGD